MTMRPSRWRIDPVGSSVTFTASSTVHAIHATGSASGWFEGVFDDRGFAPGQQLNGRIEVPVAELSSGNPIIDREMRRRIDANAHPVIAARIESTEELDGHLARVTGTVEFLEVGTLVEGELRLLPGPRLAGIGEFDTRWWGMEPPRLFMLRVDPIVTVEIDLALVGDIGG